MPDEAATLTLGAQLATLPCPQVVYLYGDLGAGKTTLVRGALRALGYEGAVRSPTYTLLERYELGGKVIVHFDLYRLADPEELHALGLREMLEEVAMLFFEWPERGEGLLPPATLTLRFNLEGDGRRVHGAVPSP
ncbi:MAG: tRNA (adenosine(37)-N6)-threonylcarbamoyltransferase complex ATPase subunit type 1 TsaE [Pseudomonadales bacterium]|nr:tRNA (adenosine(37)-N6)-threonylcarbamoyltransferase complex ATPase subunit type 1 TsaE [Pseudomonadales bacterium]